MHHNSELRKKDEFRLVSFRIGDVSVPATSVKWDLARELVAASYGFVQRNARAYQPLCCPAQFDPFRLFVTGVLGWFVPRVTFSQPSLLRSLGG
ncbi:hypothetical protein PC114_g19025 [Phytophthora cactorum]|nr:hypothetical protein PC114_g19025 [Phytophthora cactorum]